MHLFVSLFCRGEVEPDCAQYVLRGDSVGAICLQRVQC